MTSERWRQIEALFHSALERPPEQRAGFLSEACAGDESLRQKVESLIASHEKEGSFIDSPAYVAPARLAGQSLGSYEILSLLDSGGMGEVYKAKDTRLGRTVAIKILPSHLSHNPERRQRFEREARAISRLNDPHICTLYDIGHQDGIAFLVMEYLEGETLDRRLARTAMPTDQVLRYAVEIASALNTAHRQGIVHRDLKPGNIMLTKSGAKLLDFGVARLGQPESVSFTDSSAVATQDPQVLTNEGTIVGTLQYMAPEQLEGKKTDARTDVFAFGLVIYEMTTGRKAFEAKSQAGLIAKILEMEPDPISKLQPTAPAALDRLIRKCLTKDPDERWQSSHDLKIELQWITENLQTGTTESVSPKSALAQYFGWAAAALLAVVLAAQFMFRPAGVNRELAPIRFSVSPPQHGTFSYYGTSPTLSPNGRHLAFRATNAEGKTMLWIRPLDSLEAKALPGTEGATYHFFWSPNSAFIGFFAEGKLKKIDIRDRLPQVLASVTDSLGGAWSRDGMILFAPSFGASGLQRVSASGGEVSVVTKLDPVRSEIAHRWPHFMADGRHFVYLSISDDYQKNALYYASLDSSEKKQILNINSNVAFSSPDYVLYVKDYRLVAQRFNFTKLQVDGEPVQIEEGVNHNLVTNRAAFSVSENGILSYWKGGVTPKSQFVWLDRSGKEVGRVSATGQYSGFSLSPDGKSVAVQIPDIRLGTSGIWLLDLARGVTMRVTSHPSNELFPVWSPGGDQLVFTSDRNGREDLYRIATSGAGADEPLYQSTAIHIHPQDWSRDGRFFLYEIHDPKGGADLWILPMFGDRKPFPYFQSSFAEHYARFSPDARWIAYTSDESGTTEVYIQSFPAAGRKWRISVNGGDQPRWRGDGKELFYVAPGSKVMAAELTAKGSGQEVSAPRFLFEAANWGGVTADGQRFLLSKPIEETIPSIDVFLNWRPE